MTKEQNKETTQAELEARRKIVKGIAAGLPAVLTLSSGSATANVSTLECINGQGRYQPTPNLNTPAVPPGTTARDCAEAADVNLAPFESDIYIKSDFDAARQLVTDPAATGYDKYCVVYVDQNGGFIAPDRFESGVANSYPVTASCYTSFTTV